MLEPLTTSFNIVGSGLSALKDIQKSYENLRNSFKKNETTITKPFEKMKNALNNSFSFVRNGTVKVGNAFKTMAARSELAMEGIEKKSSSLKNTFMKLVGLISGGLLIKTAFDTSSTLELQRTAITNLKGEKRAGELMNFGVDFANKTPFETLEVMDAVKKLEIRGLNPETYLPMIGDMSAALGKGLDQGIEAILDMKVGEFERMKEFGLSKRDIEKLAPSAFDKKGSVVNSELMFEKTMKKIKESYEGAMITASKTSSGLISTIKGNFQTLLAELFSGSKSGIVIKDSPLFVFKTKILEPLVVYLDKASKDGTIKRWSQNIIEWTGKAVEFIKKSFGYLKNIFDFAKRNKEPLLALASGFLAIKLSLGALNGVVGVVNTLTLSAKGFESLAGFVGLTASKLGLVVFGIGALVAGLVYAYRNFEWFRDIVDFTFTHLIGFISYSIEKIKDMIEWVKDLGEKLKDSFSLFKTENGFKTSLEMDVPEQVDIKANLKTNSLQDSSFAASNLVIEKLTKEKVIEKNNEVMNDNIKGSNITNTSNSSNKTVNNTNTFIIQSDDEQKTKKTIMEVLYEEKIKAGEI